MDNTNHHPVLKITAVVLSVFAIAITSYAVVSSNKLYSTPEASRRKALSPTAVYATKYPSNYPKKTPTIAPTINPSLYPTASPTPTLSYITPTPTFNPSWYPTPTLRPSYPPSPSPSWWLSPSPTPKSR